MTRKIKLVDFLGIKYVYINRGINNFLFTQQELTIAKKRYGEYIKLK